MFVVGRTVLMSWRVKLEKKLAYKHKEKRHYKHLVAIPEAALQRVGWSVGWSPGEELEWVISGNSLVLKSAAEK
jgi:hypothetical protein